MQIIIQNLMTSYSRMGNGKVVLLLHGWGQSANTFHEIQKTLSVSHDVIALDLPGFGKSQQPDSDWGIKEYAFFVKNFTDKLGVHPDIIIGHSFGGRVTIKLVGTSILKPRKIVLIGSAGIRPPVTSKQRVIEHLSKASKKIPYTSSLRAMMRQRYASVDYKNAGAMSQIFLKTINEDLQNNARHITRPTLLMWGGRDDQTPVSDAKKFTQLITNSSLVVYKDAGHFVYKDKSEEVVGEIERFIQ